MNLPGCFCEFVSPLPVLAHDRPSYTCSLVPNVRTPNITEFRPDLLGTYRLVAEQVLASPDALALDSKIALNLLSLIDLYTLSTSAISHLEHSLHAVQADLALQREPFEAQGDSDCGDDDLFSFSETDVSDDFATCDESYDSSDDAFSPSNSLDDEFSPRMLPDDEDFFLIPPRQYTLPPFIPYIEQIIELIRLQTPEFKLPDGI